MCWVARIRYTAANRIAPRLWLPLKPTHACHMVVWRVSTGEVPFIASATALARGRNLSVKKV